MGRVLDLNADIGESFGPWTMGRDPDLLNWVTSANVACGWHAGDPDTMAHTVALVARRGVALGAHPGLPDRQGFGRRAMAVTPAEVHNLVLYQIGALAAFAKGAGARLAHVKLHGALYHQAAADPRLAEAVAAAVRTFDGSLSLFGPAGSHLVSAGQAAGLRVAREGFADRRYAADGGLVPRGDPAASIRDPDEAVAQALSLAAQGVVTAHDGTRVPMVVDTLCIHGDNAEALAFAQRLHGALKASGIGLAQPGRVT